MEKLKENKSFGGWCRVYQHHSTSTATEMKFSTFEPEGEIKGCLIWLSGLTCDESNFITKAGAQKYLAENNLMLVCPDTSPRGLKLPGEHDSWDFGSGAGFYVNATTPGYKDHYNMYDYITKELYSLIESKFNVKKFSISGHSMGGHGALVIGLREKDKFQSVSAFSPIVNPIQCPWGQKAFNGYLGEDKSTWNAYDACELIKSGKTQSKILIDQGSADEFLERELLTDNFIGICKESGQKTDVNYREGYDHSYYFIASFIENHVNFHAQSLK